MLPPPAAVTVSHQADKWFLSPSMICPDRDTWANSEMGASSIKREQGQPGSLQLAASLSSQPRLSFCLALGLS